MFTFIVVCLLIVSACYNVVQKVKSMRSSRKGRAALKAIATIANYTQNAIISSENLEAVKTKISAEALKTQAQTVFIAEGISEDIKKDLKSLWAKGLAKIDKII